MDQHVHFSEPEIDYMLTVYCNSKPQIKVYDYFDSMLLKVYDGDTAEIKIKNVEVVEMHILNSRSKIILSGVK
jgi:hypothetical protein